NGASLKNVEPAPDQREILRGKIGNRGRESDFPVKPRLDGVLVRRNDVGQVAGLEGADVRVHEFRSGRIRRRSNGLRPSAVSWNKSPGTPGDKQKNGRGGKPLPDRRILWVAGRRSWRRRGSFVQLATNFVFKTCGERFPKLSVLHRSAHRLQC